MHAHAASRPSHLRALPSACSTTGWLPSFMRPRLMRGPPGTDSGVGCGVAGTAGMVGGATGVVGGTTGVTGTAGTVGTAGTAGWADGVGTTAGVAGGEGEGEGWAPKKTSVLSPRPGTTADCRPSSWRRVQPALPFR